MPAKLKAKLFVVAALTIALTLPAAAALAGIPGLQSPRYSRTFYVDSFRGSDANDGASPATAWESLKKVDATTFIPGDRILLRSGSVWMGQLSPKGSGSEGMPIIVDMFGGGVMPVIQGAGETEDALLLKNQEYWEIQNLEITNTGTTGAIRRGVHLALENYGEALHIYIRSLVIHDVNGSDKVKQNGGINYTCQGDSKPSRFVDLRIENNEIYHVDRSGIFGWSDRWQRTKWFPSLDVAIRGNRLHDIGGDGIVVVATGGAVVEHNTVGHANQRSAGYNAAIWPWSADNTVLQYNEAYGTKGQRDGEGFDSDWNSRNTLIQYNYSHDNDGGFLLICDDGSQKPEISAGNTGTIVRYNISVNDRTRGINIAGPVKNSRIYNNTIYVGKDRNLALLLHWDWHGWAKAVYFYNNIFYVEGRGEFSYGLSRNENGAFKTASGFGMSSENVFDSNVYFGNVSPPDDPHAITGDPKFVAPGTEGFGPSAMTAYQLQTGSPAQGTGKTIQSSGGKDFGGRPVPSCGRTDRGAWQSDDCGGQVR